MPGRYGVMGMESEDMNMGMDMANDTKMNKKPKKANKMSEKESDVGPVGNKLSSMMENSDSMLEKR